MEKYIPKSFRQIVAMVLCLAMLVPMIVAPVAASELTDLTEGASVVMSGEDPAEEESADEPSEEPTEAPTEVPTEAPVMAASEDDPIELLSDGDVITVIAGSDFQNEGDSTDTNLVLNILNQIKVDNEYVDGFLFCGDYARTTSTDTDKSTAGKVAVQETLLGMYGSLGLTADEMVWVQGNHDPDELVGGVLSSSGAHDADEYGVYVINEKDYMWYNNDEATIKKTAAALETYLDAKVAAKYTKPIFVVSHLPLHYSMRTANDGDAQYANYIFDVLNEAGADGLNIIFLYGHDHSNGWDDYLGGSAVYLTKGDSINIAQSSKTNFAAKKLNFTYMNAGYVAYYTTPTTGAETDLTMTVFKITDDEVTVARYTTSAVHDLKSAGVKNTTKGDTFEPDTRVISSPQTITLNKTFKATATSAETGVSVSGMGITGMTVEKVEQDVPTGYSAYATYDITPTGFAGGTATVTIEVDDSFDASRSVTVIDVKTGDTQICQIVNGKVTFTTTHFSLYTVAQTEADTASGEGTLEKYLKQITSVNDLETGVPYIISDYNKEWVLTNITGRTAKNSYPGLVLDGTPSVDTPYLWYINNDGYLVYGSADSTQYLLVGSGQSGNRTASIGALTESNAGFAANIVTYSGADFNIKNAEDTGFLNRYGGGTTDNVATSYIDTVGGSGNSYWHIYQLVSDAAVTMSINATSQTITEGGTSKLTPVVTVGGVNTTDYTVTWTSMDESIATVSSSGVVTPKKYGQAYIRATLSSANGVDLASDISVDVLVTVVSVYKTDASVTATTYLGQRLGAQDTPTAGNMYAIRFYSGQQWYLTGTTLLQGDAGYNGLNGIEGLELTSDIPLYDGTWYYDGTYLYSGTSADSSKYLIYDGAKVTVGSNSDSNVPFTVDKRTYEFWPYIVLSNDIDNGSKRLNQLGGYPHNVVGMYNHNNLMRFYKVLAPAQEVALTVTPKRDTIYPGYTSTLAPTVLIDGAEVSNNTISWTSSNTAVATVSNGVVTAKKGGSTTITATLTAADGTSLGTSVSVEIPIQVIDVTESDGTVTSTVTVEKKMSPVAELVADTASGPYIITNKGTGVVLTGNMMTKDNPAYNGNSGKVGLELSKYNDFSELWYFDGTYLRYGSANGPYLTLANDQVYLSDSANNAADILTLNEDGLSYTITSNAVMNNSTYTHKYMNHYGGGIYNVVYYWSQDGNANDGSAWYLNTITPGRTATISLTAANDVYEGESITLTPTVTLEGAEQTTYKLNWTSTVENCATVYGGKVTGVDAGTTNIRATVRSINGEKFDTEIFVEVPINVIGISSAELSSTTGSVAQRATTATSTGVTMTVSYTDGTTKTIPVTVSMLTDANGKRVSTYNAGTYSNLTVNYGSCQVDGFTLTVVAPDKPDYPAYPAEGSVFVDKTGTGVDFQSSGVAQIELTAGGIPSKTGADVIIMLDTSSSMRNKVGDTTTTRIQVLTESLNNLLNQLQQKDASGNQMDIRVAVADFNGYYYNYPDSPYYVEATDTTVGNSIRSEQAYQVSSNAIFTGTKDLTAGAFVDVRDIGRNPFTCENYAGETSKKYTLNTHSGTNYDYAFDAIYQLAEAVNEANSTGEARDLFVIFMSDGAPFQFNYFSSLSGFSGSDYWNNWLMGTFDEATMYKEGANQSYYHEDGLHWMAEAIKGDPTEDYSVIRKNDERDTDHDNWITLPGLGATMYSIGFCLAPDSKITVDAMDTVIRNIASDSKYYFRADTAADLSDAFNLISNEIFYAASDAYFIDEMGEDYDLLLGTHSYQDINKADQTVESAIEVRSYSTWTYQDVENGLCDASLVGTRKTNSSGNYVYTLLERVTFNTAGTEAYSNKLSASGNILKNGVICANTFWYNTNKYVNETNTGAVAIDTNGDGTTDYTLPAETFYWKLGTVSNAQMTLSYYVYLEDCGVKSKKEPGVPAGIYDTNEHAEMYYVNYLGNDCVQSVETPRLPWKQATVGYGFYLVDSNGNPIVNQSTGETGSFERAVKITQPVYQEFLLNSDGADIVAEIISGGDVLPEGYKLFDEGAEYEVQLNSNGTGWYIIYTDKETGKQTTYVVGVTSTPVSNDPSKEYETFEDEDGNSKGIGQKVNTESYTTANTVVWFGVVATVECVPDTVVIDFGLPVEIDVIANDIMMGDHGELKYIGKTDAFDEGYATAKAQAAEKGASLKFWAYLQTIKGDQTAAVNGESADGTYGVGKISNGKVRYTLNDAKAVADAAENDNTIVNGMQMKEEETFVYAVNYTGDVGRQGYYYSTVTVIPATTIYYEDAFVNFTVWDNNVTLIEDADKQWKPVGTAQNPDQAQDRPGEFSLSDQDANNIYGYDGAYTSMATYSMGSAMKVTVNKDLFAEAQFTFNGTGFDVVSMTTGTTGTIMVDVYDADEFTAKGYEATPLVTRMVDTYYGYKYVLCDVIYLWRTDDNGKYFWERNVGDEVTNGTEQRATLPENPEAGDTAEGVEYCWIADTTATDSLYQVPVMKVKGLTYNKYTVVITAAYMEAVDHQNTDGKGEYDFYLDAIRIYDPANDGTGNETIKDAYVDDGEGWPEYFELRNLIISKNDFNNLVDGAGEGIVFIDNTVDENYNITYTISDYTNYGPNNEVYLAPGQAVAFQLAIPDNVAKIHLAMKSVGGTANVKVYDADDNTQTSVTPTTIATATDLYYDITSLNNKTVVITNTGESGDAILSITNVKVTYTSAHTDSIENSYFPTSQEGAEAAVASLMMMRAPAVPDVPEETEPEVTKPETTEPVETEPEVTEPETTEPVETEPEVTEPETTEPEETEPEATEPEATEPEEPDVFQPAKFQVSVSDSTPSKGSLVKVTVSTSADVDHVTVNGKTITKYSTSWFSSNRTWSTWITAENAGEMVVSVICYNAEDLASEAVTKTLTVSEKTLLGKIWDLIGGWWKP